MCSGYKLVLQLNLKTQWLQIHSAAAVLHSHEEMGQKCLQCTAGLALDLRLQSVKHINNLSS